MTTYSDTETQGVYERAKKNMRWAVDEIVRLRAELSALRSPAPAATVTGWRPEWGLLNPGDVIQYGDEYHIDDEGEGEWRQHLAAVGEKVVKGDCVRRRLTPPALTDATILPREIGAVVDRIESTFPGAAWSIGKITNDKHAIPPIGAGYSVTIALDTKVVFEKSIELSVALERAMNRMRSAVAAVRGAGGEGV